MRLSLEELNPRVCPSGGSVWVYDQSGTVLGRALHRDDAHPAYVYTPPALTAYRHPTIPGNPAHVQEQLAPVPRPVQGWITAHGGRVVVFGAAYTLDDVPELAAYRGTWPRGAVAATDLAAATAFVRENVPWPTVHETGHVVWALVPAAWRDEWTTRIHPAVNWDTFPSGASPSIYFRDNPVESFAEGWRAVWMSGNLTPPVVRDYFARLIHVNGMDAWPS